MQNFIEQNRKLLWIYYFTARVIGWVFIILTAMAIVGIILLPLMLDTENKPILPKTTAELLTNRAILGIILLGVAQLIKFATRLNNKKPFLLRYGNWVLYFLAVLVFGIYIAKFYLSPEFYESGSLDPSSNIILYFLPNVATILILIGLGYFLQRILPIIEEQKTLV